jgi:antitoxin PrlF
MESSITSKGQISIPRMAREHLNVRPGDRVRIFLHPNGTVVLLPRLPASAIKGIFAGRAKKPVTVEEMDEAVEQGAMGDERPGHQHPDSLSGAGRSHPVSACQQGHRSIAAISSRFFALNAGLSSMSIQPSSGSSPPARTPRRIPGRAASTSGPRSCRCARWRATRPGPSQKSSARAGWRPGNPRLRAPGI